MTISSTSPSASSVGLAGRRRSIRVRRLSRAVAAADADRSCCSSCSSPRSGSSSRKLRYASTGPIAGAAAAGRPRLTRSAPATTAGHRFDAGAVAPTAPPGLDASSSWTGEHALITILRSIAARNLRRIALMAVVAGLSNALVLALIKHGRRPPIQQRRRRWRRRHRRRGADVRRRGPLVHLLAALPDVRGGEGGRIPDPPLPHAPDRGGAAQRRSPTSSTSAGPRIYNGLSKEIQTLAQSSATLALDLPDVHAGAVHHGLSGVPVDDRIPARDRVHRRGDRALSRPGRSTRARRSRRPPRRSTGWTCWSPASSTGFKEGQAQRPAQRRTGRGPVAGLCRRPPTSASRPISASPRT